MIRARLFPLLAALLATVIGTVVLLAEAGPTGRGEADTRCGGSGGAERHDGWEGAGSGRPCKDGAIVPWWGD